MKIFQKRTSCAEEQYSIGAPGAYFITGGRVGKVNCKKILYIRVKTLFYYFSSQRQFFYVRNYVS